MRICFWAASAAQEERGVWSMRKGDMSSVYGKRTRVSFFSLRQDPLFLNRFRCRIRIFGALYICITFLASLCSLQLGQYHSLPLSSSSSSLRFMKQSLSSTAAVLSSQLPLRRTALASSQSFRFFIQKQPRPASLKRTSSSHSPPSMCSHSCSIDVSSKTYTSAEQRCSMREQCRSTLRWCRRNRRKGLFWSISASQDSQSVELRLRKVVGYRNCKTRLQMASPLVVFSKRRGNLNHRFSNSPEWQQAFLASRMVSSTGSAVRSYSSLSSNTNTFLFSFSILQTISLRESLPATYTPSYMLTKQTCSESSAMPVALEMFRLHSGRFGLPQEKLIFRVFSAKLVLKTKHSKLLVARSEMGRVTVMKGSKVMLSLRQVGQVTLDLYCPVMRSVMTDWLRRMWASQLSVATARSDLPALQMDSTQGFFSMRLRSSWMPSMRKEKNSWESCWAQPENMGLMALTALLMRSGECTPSRSHHMALMNIAQFRASLPFVPSGFTRLISGSKSRCRKQWVSGAVLERHCRQLFMKQVLPRLRRPTRPRLLPSPISILKLRLNSSISACSQRRMWQCLSLSMHFCEQQATLLHLHENFSSVKSQQPWHCRSPSAYKNHFPSLELRSSTTRKSSAATSTSSTRMSAASFLPKPLMRTDMQEQILATARCTCSRKEAAVSPLPTFQSLPQCVGSSYSWRRMALVSCSTVAFSDSSMVRRAKASLRLARCATSLTCLAVSVRQRYSLRQTGTLRSTPNVTTPRRSSFALNSPNTANTSSERISKSSFSSRPGRSLRVPGRSRSSFMVAGSCRSWSWLRQKSRQVLTKRTETRKQVSL